MATSFVETSGTLTNTTASVSANAGRRGLIVANPSDTVMTLRVGGTASATVGIPVPPGDSIAFRDARDTPDGSISLFCAGTSKAYTIYEW
jgi:hypothetical protein